MVSIDCESPMNFMNETADLDERFFEMMNQPISSSGTSGTSTPPSSCHSEQGLNTSMFSECNSVNSNSRVSESNATVAWAPAQQMPQQQMQQMQSVMPMQYQMPMQNISAPNGYPQTSNQSNQNNNSYSSNSSNSNSNQNTVAFICMPIYPSMVDESGNLLPGKVQDQMAQMDSPLNVSQLQPQQQQQQQPQMQMQQMQMPMQQQQGNNLPQGDLYNLQEQCQNQIDMQRQQQGFMQQQMAMQQQQVQQILSPQMGQQNMSHQQHRNTNRCQWDNTSDNSTQSKNKDDVSFILRNIPNKYTQSELLEDLSEFAASIDFLYLPIDFKNSCNLGYAFINFADGPVADQFLEKYQNGHLARYPRSPKVLTVEHSRVQGNRANTKRFRNSSVMGVLAQEAKPMLFKNGKQIPFPQPMKALPPVGPRYQRKGA